MSLKSDQLEILFGVCENQLSVLDSRGGQISPLMHVALCLFIISTLQLICFFIFAFVILWGFT